MIHVFIFMTFFPVGSALPRKRAKPAKIQKERKWKVQDTPISLYNFAALIWENLANLIMVSVII